MAKKIAILGAGPAGLTAGYLLSKNGYAVDIYEASDTVGGMCRSITLNGYIVDMGPHRFFSKEKNVNKLWLDIVKEDYLIVNRTTRIFYNSRFFDYPINVIEALKGFGMKDSIRVGLDYIYARIFPREIKTLEDFYVSAFGQCLYDIFFKSYSEKLWGAKCTEIDADWTRQRIKKFSFAEAIKNALLKPKNNTHKTIAEVFPYPKKGTGYVYAQMADAIRNYGGNILLNTKINKLIIKDYRICGVYAENQEKTYDEVVSTIPLKILIDSFSNVTDDVKEAFKRLRFRNTILVYVEVNDNNLFKDQWIYIQDPHINMLRITNYRNWSPELYKEKQESVLALEYTCWDEDDLWTKSNDELIDMAKNDLYKLDFMKNKQILSSSVVKLPQSYPFYHTGYKKEIKIIKDFLTKYCNLQVIGRGGSYKYNNQDHSILMGILATENIINGAKHDTWEVNEDTQYQESAIITKDGLKIVD